MFVLSFAAFMNLTQNHNLEFQGDYLSKNNYAYARYSNEYLDCFIDEDQKGVCIKKSIKKPIIL